MRWTASTLGARFFSTRERDSTYLCSVAYSRAEMVYRNALRRTGSAVAFADTDGFLGGAAVGGGGLELDGPPDVEAIGMVCVDCDCGRVTAAVC